MSFAEHKPAGRPVDGVGVSLSRAAGALKVHISIGPGAVSALGVAAGARIAVLVGAGVDAGSLRLKRVDRGGRKLRRPQVKPLGKGAACLKLVTAVWAGLPDQTRRMERRPFATVGAGEIELVLPDWNTPCRPGASTAAPGAPAQPKAAPKPAGPETVRPDPTPPETPPRASAAAPTARPKKARPEKTRPETARVKTTPPKIKRAATGRARVRDVAALVKDGLSPAAIAERLAITVNTVGFYTHAARKDGLLPPFRRPAKAGRRSRAGRRSPFEAPDDVTADLTGDPGWEPGA